VTAPTFHRIAVAVDGSPHAELAVAFAIDLAKRYGSELTVLGIAPLIPLYVSSSEPWVPTEVPESEAAHYHSVVDTAVARAKKEGLSAVTGVTLEGVIVDELLGYLEAHPTDLLVMGSRGLTATKRLLLGSVSDAVLHHVKCPVLVVRGDVPPATPTRPPSA
jgi:nucleotide-binding universal stress UspA family protein